MSAVDEHRSEGQEAHAVGDAGRQAVGVAGAWPA